MSSSVTPKVSILVPVYNSQDFIEETLNSILSQDYLNTEIIVADDASTDDSIVVIKKIVAQNPGRIRTYFNSENLGISKNMNQLLKLSTGEFISLFAGDDIMLPKKISTQVNIMISNPDVVMTYHPVEVFQTESNRVIRVSGASKRENTDSPEEIISKMGISGCMSVMIRTDAIPEGGFNEEIKFVNDWLFQIEVAMKGRILKIDNILCRYRKYGQNNGKDISSYFWEFDRVLDIVLEKYGKNIKVRNSVRQGRARIYAGHGFRQMESDSNYANIIFYKALKLEPFNFFYIACFIISKSPILSKFVFNNKLFLKKFIK